MTDHPIFGDAETIPTHVLQPQSLQPQTLQPQTLQPQTLQPQTLQPQTLQPQTLWSDELAFEGRDTGGFPDMGTVPEDGPGAPQMGMTSGALGLWDDWGV